MGTAGRLLLIALTPTVVAGAVLLVPRWLRATLRRLRTPPPSPPGPPLERIAGDLRRLLAEHAAVRSSPDVAVRAGHLTALEGAITDCALDAARAVGLSPPARTGRGPLPRDELRRLLADLREQGLVMPAPERFGR